MFCVLTNAYPVFVRIKKGSYHNSVITIDSTHHCYKKITSSLMYALDVIPFLCGHVYGWYIQTKTSRNKLCVIFNISCYEFPLHIPVPFLYEPVTFYIQQTHKNTHDITTYTCFVFTSFSCNLIFGYTIYPGRQCRNDVYVF